MFYDHHGHYDGRRIFFFFFFFFQVRKETPYLIDYEEVGNNVLNFFSPGSPILIYT
jgi:hypothetical protein